MKTDDLVKAAGISPKEFSVYRDRLIKRGILMPSGHGRLSLALPRFDVFVSRQEL